MTLNTHAKEYAEKFKAFKAGTLSEADWRAYCDKTLNQLLVDNSDVFIRLKNCK